MAITIKHQGQRIYFLGDTFAHKDRIKAVLNLTGKNFDSDRRAWWCGTAKLALAEKLVAELNAASSPGAKRPKENPGDIRLTGKGRYKGREYFAGSITRDGLKVRLLTLPDAKGEFLDFWAPCSEVEQTKAYSPREYRGHMEYTTLGGIARFVEREKRNRDAGREVCAECGKSGELVADLEDGQMKHPRCCDIPPN